MRLLIIVRMAYTSASVCMCVHAGYVGASCEFIHEMRGTKYRGQRKWVESEGLMGTKDPPRPDTSWELLQYVTNDRSGMEEQGLIRNSIQKQ